MVKIVVPQNLNLGQTQIERLKALGDLQLFDNPENPEEWLERCQDADVILSGSRFMKTEVYKLKDKFFTIPMVGYSWLDIDQLKTNNITLANCPGCNKYAVAEWIIAMVLQLLRNFRALTNTKQETSELSFPTHGIRYKNITILGKGNIGKLTAKILTELGANITFFEHNDDLAAKTKNADIIINCLSTNPSTENLLDATFFNNLKKGTFFVTITPNDIIDNEAMFSALDNEIIAGIATDCASVGPRDTSDSYYKQMSSHPKIMATPHIASFTDVSVHDEGEIMIDNIEAWLQGKPINIVTKYV